MLDITDWTLICALVKAPVHMQVQVRYTAVYTWAQSHKSSRHCNVNHQPTLPSPQLKDLMGCLNHFMQEMRWYITPFYLWSVFVHSPPDRPHLIMLFCFLISRNAKCLCHLWTAKSANLGFSLIATVTSLLRLRWGWVEGMAGGGWRMEGWRDGGMKTQLSSHTGRGVKERGGPTERSLEESNSREWGTACAVKKPQHPAEKEEDSAPASSAPSTLMRRWLHWVGYSLWTLFWHWHLLLAPSWLKILVPTHIFCTILLIDK